MRVATSRDSFLLLAIVLSCLPSLASSVAIHSDHSFTDTIDDSNDSKVHDRGGNLGLSSESLKAYKEQEDGSHSLWRRVDYAIIASIKKHRTSSGHCSGSDRVKSDTSSCHQWAWHVTGSDKVSDAKGKILSNKTGFETSKFGSNKTKEDNDGRSFRREHARKLLINRSENSQAVDQQNDQQNSQSQRSGQSQRQWQSGGVSYSESSDGNQSQSQSQNGDQSESYSKSGNEMQRQRQVKGHSVHSESHDGTRLQSQTQSGGEIKSVKGRKGGRDWLWKREENDRSLRMRASHGVHKRRLNSNVNLIARVNHRQSKEDAIAGKIFEGRDGLQGWNWSPGSPPRRSLHARNSWGWGWTGPPKRNFKKRGEDEEEVQALSNHPPLKKSDSLEKDLKKPKKQEIIYAQDPHGLPKHIMPGPKSPGKGKVIEDKMQRRVHHRVIWPPGFRTPQPPGETDGTEEPAKIENSRPAHMPRNEQDSNIDNRDRIQGAATEKAKNTWGWGGESKHD